jgi:murein DD-endopeptidase MepM/ murein hydrolase activator NlpD
MRHRKSIVIFSEKGKPVISLSISRPAGIIAVSLAIFGIAAYFIPFRTFHFSAADFRQQQDLGKNNTLLRRKIQSATQTLEQAMVRIDLLNAKKERVASHNAGVTSARSSASGMTEPEREVSAEELCVRVTHIDSIIEHCTTKLEGGDHLFDNIPVCNPVPGEAVICRRFDMEQDPFSGQKKNHLGVDIAATPGRAIIATASGTVTCTEDSSVWGKRVVIEHGNGFHTVYAHLGTITVGRGSKVKRGVTIGTVGCTGFATGPHVHYEIWRNGKAVDPERYFYPSSNEIVKIMQ